MFMFVYSSCHLNNQKRYEYSKNLNTPKNPYLNQATPENTCQIFLPKQIPELKISPKTIL